jgi:signal transduction histidine kinase
MTGAGARHAATGVRTRGLHVHPAATDLLVVLGLLLVGIAQAHHLQDLGGGPPGARILLVLALILPLAWRRQAPPVVFGVVAAVAFGQWLSGPLLLADISLLWAFYAVAAYSPVRRLVVAAVVLEVGVVMAVVRDSGAREHSQNFLLLTLLVTAAGVLGVNAKIRRAYLAGVEQRAAQLEFERDQQSQLAVAAERTHIAREMHDVIAHNLTVMIALTDGAALTVATDPSRAAGAITEASAAGRTALGEMRRVLGVLRDGGESAALAPAPGLGDLDTLLDTVRRTGLDVQFETSGQLGNLGSGLELTIYRLIQEAVTNTVKHALAPTRIVARLTRSNDEVIVSITDDGGAPTGSGTGQGLVGMRERVAVHSGRVQAEPTAAGWQVTAWLPVAGQAAHRPEPAATSS